jgi:hypothetical protein
MPWVVTGVGPKRARYPGGNQLLEQAVALLAPERDHQRAITVTRELVEALDEQRPSCRFGEIRESVRAPAGRSMIRVRSDMMRHSIRCRFPPARANRTATVRHE